MASHEDTSRDFTQARRGAFLVLWTLFISYAFLFAPGSADAMKAADKDLLLTLVTSPLSPAVNPIFVTIFNCLGIMPIVYTLLLLPGAGDQRVPAWPFCALSVFLGFFAMGPYLAFREFRRQYSPSSQSSLVRSAVESKVAPVLLLLSATALGYFGLSAVTGPQGQQVLSSFTELFGRQMFVHVSTLDLLVLSASVWEPMREDMIRRHCYSLPMLVACTAVPVVGPCMYLLLRPSLAAATTNEEKDR